MFKFKFDKMEIEIVVFISGFVGGLMGFCLASWYWTKKIQEMKGTGDNKIIKGIEELKHKQEQLEK